MCSPSSPPSGRGIPKIYSGEIHLACEHEHEQEHEQEGTPLKLRNDDEFEISNLESAIRNPRGVVINTQHIPHRMEHEPPFAVAQRGWRFHHLGIPTDEKRPGERYLPALGMYVSGFPESEFGIEWMRFEQGSPVHELIRRIPHLAFEVDDLDTALEGREVLTPPNEPSGGVRVAMIVENGAPVELMEFKS